MREDFSSKRVEVETKTLQVSSSLKFHHRSNHLCGTCIYVCMYLCMHVCMYVTTFGKGPDHIT